MRRVLSALAVVVVVATAGCGGDDGPGDADPPATAPAGTGAGDLGLLDPAALGAVRVVVTYADGSTREWCLLLADDDDERGQGLMSVTDVALGGYDGMVFAYDEPTSGRFWMRNTRLPLTVTFVAADGRPVTTIPMEPCPDDQPSCPTYGPGTAYRWAIEVPTALASEVPLADAATIEVTGESCSV